MVCVGVWRHSRHTPPFPQRLRGTGVGHAGAILGSDSGSPSSRGVYRIQVGGLTPSPGWQAPHLTLLVAGSCWPGLDLRHSALQHRAPPGSDSHPQKLGLSLRHGAYAAKQVFDRERKSVPSPDCTATHLEPLTGLRNPCYTAETVRKPVSKTGVLGRSGQGGVMVRDLSRRIRFSGKRLYGTWLTLAVILVVVAVSPAAASTDNKGGNSFTPPGQAKKDTLRWKATQSPQGYSHWLGRCGRRPSPGSAVSTAVHR